MRYWPEPECSAAFALPGGPAIMVRRRAGRLSWDRGDRLRIVRQGLHTWRQACPFAVSIDAAQACRERLRLNACSGWLVERRLRSGPKATTNPEGLPIG